jgi:hypothetical protein
MRASVRGLAVFFLLTLVLPGAGSAQEKAFRWADLAVRARLDAEGVLHVEERHAMVFTGDWNGGERRFNLRLGQHLNLENLRRIDPATGSALPLVEGDLALVDHYAWAGSSTLRWRSRLASDPPFQSTAMTYVLDYTLTGVLAKSGGQYHLWEVEAVGEAAQAAVVGVDGKAAGGWSAARVHLPRASVIVNSAPRPLRFAASIRPPCASTIRLQMLRPRP